MNCKAVADIAAVSDVLLLGPIPWWVAIALGLGLLIVRHERAVKRDVAGASALLAREGAYQETRARQSCRPSGGVERIP